MEQGVKNKAVVIAIVIILLVLGGYFAFLGNRISKQPVSQEIKEEVVPTVNPSDLGLQLFVRSDKKAVRFEMDNAKDIALVEYQISYTKEVNNEQVPEGLIGEVRPKQADKKIAIDYRELGTCSAKVCRYDTVVSPVRLTLKISKTNGKVYQSESAIKL